MGKEKVTHKMGRAASRPEFDVNSGSGQVGSFHLWIGLGRVKKMGPPTLAQVGNRGQNCVACKVAGDADCFLQSLAT